MKTQVIIKQVDCGVSTWRSRRRNSSSCNHRGRSRDSSQTCLVARLVNLHLVRSSLPTKRSSPWQGGVGDQSGLPSPSSHSQSPPVTYSGIFEDCFVGQVIVAICTLQHPRNGTLMPLMVLMELSTISTSWVITTLSTSSRTYRSSLMVIIVFTNNIVNNIRDDHLQ